MEPGRALARAAEGPMGSPFRLHGRSAGTGLDCVGLIVAAMRACGRQCTLPTGYRLRTGEWPGCDGWAAACGFAVAEAPLAPGDVLMVRPGPAQLHLAIVNEAADRVIEAHAGLRKIVAGPIPPTPAVVRLWRLR